MLLTSSARASLGTIHKLLPLNSNAIRWDYKHVEPNPHSRKRSVRKEITHESHWSLITVIFSKAIQNTLIYFFTFENSNKAAWSVISICHSPDRRFVLLSTPPLRIFITHTRFINASCRIIIKQYSQLSLNSAETKGDNGNSTTYVAGFKRYTFNTERKYNWSIAKFIAHNRDYHTNSKNYNSRHQ